MNESYKVFLIFEANAGELLGKAIKEHSWYVNSSKNQKFISNYLSQNSKDDGKLLTSFEN
jgi:hypothetical protein